MLNTTACFRPLQSAYEYTKFQGTRVTCVFIMQIYKEERIFKRSINVLKFIKALV